MFIIAATIITISNNPMISLHPIKAIREKLGLSQIALSNLINLKQAQISACELRKRNLSIKSAKKLIHIAKKHGLKYNLSDLYPD